MKFFVLGFMIFIVGVSCSTQYVPTKTTEVITVEPVEVKPLETVVVPGGTQLEPAGTVTTPSEVIKLEEVPGQHHQTGDYSVKSSLKVVKQLADIGNCLVYKAKFYDEIKAHKQFDYTKDSSETVADKLSLYTPVVLTTYSKRFTKTIAYRNKGSNVIYLNLVKLKSIPTKEGVNTLWHERSHVVGYGHGDNYAAGKDNSVPYGTGKMSEKYFDECYAALK